MNIEEFIKNYNDAKNKLSRAKSDMDFPNTQYEDNFESYGYTIAICHRYKTGNLPVNIHMDYEYAGGFTQEQLKSISSEIEKFLKENYEKAKINFENLQKIALENKIEVENDRH